MSGVVRLDRDWAAAVDAAYAPVRDDAEWVALVKSRTKDLFDAEFGNAVIVIEHTGDCASATTLATAFPEEPRAIFDVGDGGHRMVGQDGFRAMYYPPLPALTHTRSRRSSSRRPSAQRSRSSITFRSRTRSASSPTPPPGRSSASRPRSGAR